MTAQETIASPFEMLVQSMDVLRKQLYDEAVIATDDYFTARRFAYKDLPYLERGRISIRFRTSKPHPDHFYIQWIRFTGAGEKHGGSVTQTAKRTQKSDYIKMSRQAKYQDTYTDKAVLNHWAVKQYEHDLFHLYEPMFRSLRRRQRILNELESKYRQLNDAYTEETR